ncbi:major facilitator superfamily domain-containing protein [Achaetomium macrosporum]|uniref:Major facilitator superfamily domain-containing protein n=1 Tax=Achaetomium macrosporum TaxID=79813 RepID=A0AAN7C3X5_9PEZI|nr:major facilitator superfamily domain-containing protein [Achaetomium macrosporum]
MSGRGRGDNQGGNQAIEHISMQDLDPESGRSEAEDHENPSNWRTWRKNTHIALVIVLTFLIRFSAGMIATSLPEIMNDFHVEDKLQLSGFVVSAYVLGHVAGPLLMVPLSEICGRLVVSKVSNAGFVAFTLVCSVAPSPATLIFFRSMAGAFGGGVLANGETTMADLKVMTPKFRLLHKLSELLGFILGPVLGGYVADALGWRRTFPLVAGAVAAVSICMVVVSRETYGPVLLKRKVARRRQETGNHLLRSALDSGLSPWEHLRRGIVRPFQVLSSSELCEVYTLFGGVMYGLQYVMLTTIGYALIRFYSLPSNGFGTYYLGLGLGCFIGWGLYAGPAARAIRGISTKHRLWPVLLGSAIALVGFGLYGSTYPVTSGYSKVWLVALAGHFFIGMGLQFIIASWTAALIDIFAENAPNALAACDVVKSICGGLFPIFGQGMYAGFGVGWANGTLASLMGVVLLTWCLAMAILR